ncbi:hypothetical protein NQ317_013224 [Molorchus minor]|uniref:Uncharacterized protein n=1 Tax=Molorchus minor TaxID=1323400 RepID=A0ABQ9JRI5_9CUCU|nr:hypothetical protein NQ317_013224 [Molorchus minor]
MYRQAIYYRRRTSVIFQRAALLYVAEFIIKIKLLATYNEIHSVSETSQCFSLCPVVLLSNRLRN